MNSLNLFLACSNRNGVLLYLSFVDRPYLEFPQNLLRNPKNEKASLLCTYKVRSFITFTSKCLRKDLWAISFKVVGKGPSS